MIICEYSKFNYYIPIAMAGQQNIKRLLRCFLYACIILPYRTDTVLTSRTEYFKTKRKEIMYQLQLSRLLILLLWRLECVFCLQCTLTCHIGYRIIRVLPYKWSEPIFLKFNRTINIISYLLTFYKCNKIYTNCLFDSRSYKIICE